MRQHLELKLTAFDFSGDSYAGSCIQDRPVMQEKMTTEEFRELLHDHVERVLSGVDPIRGKYELEADIRSRMLEVDALLCKVNVQLVDDNFRVTKAELTNTDEGPAAAA